MSTVNGVNTAASNNTSTTSSSGGLDSLDGNAFLTLLTAQLQNQDPESAQDPSEFVNQLAAFSSLEQLVDIHQLLQNAYGSSGTSNTNGTNNGTNSSS